MPTIKLKVDRRGKATVEAIDFSGSACEAATKAYEDALGKVTSRELKFEHAQQDTTTTAEQNS